MLRSDDEKHISRPIVRIATIGIAVGVALMMLSVSIVKGFQKEVKGMVVGFGSHFQVVSNRDNIGRDSQRLLFSQEVYEDLKLIENTDTLIIVTNDYTQESVNKILKNIWEKESKYIVLFSLSNLQINVLLHSFVPKHIRLTQEQKEEVFQRYNIKNNSQLPEIGRFDPAAKAILLRPGEVCEITRYDKISYMNKFYRICIS